MIAMRPITEPDVIENINAGRFNGDLQGYIIMDDATYLGYAIFTIKNDTTLILDTDLKDKIYVDGIVRACIASAENKGIKMFDINRECSILNEWWHIFCRDSAEPVSTDTIFNLC